MGSYYLPCTFVAGAEDIQGDPYGLVVRRWDVHIADLATLQTRHKLHLPFEMMSFFLKYCNLELRVEAGSVEEAMAMAHSFKAMLYLRGITPFAFPLVTTYSINDYAGINSRDSSTLRETLHPGLRDGITSETTKVEVWPFELSMQLATGLGEGNLSRDVFVQACSDVNVWDDLVRKHPRLELVQDALVTSPYMQESRLAIVQIWVAVEALFPKVSAEVSFQIALYLSQLNRLESGKYDYFARIRRAYGTRSRIVHGTNSKVGHDDHVEAWNLLRGIASAVLERQVLPTEDDLITELLGKSSSISD